MYAQAQQGYMYPQAEAAPAYPGPGGVFIADNTGGAWGAPPPAYDEATASNNNTQAPPVNTPANS
jgi:hypothetical protein